MCLVEMKNINKSYDNGKNAVVHALKDVTLTLERGEFVSLMGVSGSGKSTLLHVMGCSDGFDSGTYFFDGKEVAACTDKEKAIIRNRGIGFVLQNLGLIQGQTVLENVMLPLLLNEEKHVKKPELAVTEILEFLGIEEKKNTVVENLSGGQKQRVAIARAVINHPELILADEPTAALDHETAMEVMTLLQKLNRELGCTVLISTHDPVIAQDCVRQLRIADGILIDEKQ